MEKKKVKKILATIGTVLLYIFMAICLLAVLLTIFSKRSEDGAVSLFGHEMRLVLTGSMEKSDMTDVSGFDIKDIPANSLIVTENVPEDEEEAEEWFANLKEGDVLTFRYIIGGGQETITHRIILIEPQAKGFKLTLRGDNRTENEGVQIVYTDELTNPEPGNYVVGKVVFTSLALGEIVYILQKPVGIALVVIVPASIIIILQVIRIVNVFAAEKRKKAAEREAKQSDEIELLKKRLAEMEMRQGVPEGTMSEDGPSETPQETPVAQAALPPLAAHGEEAARAGAADVAAEEALQAEPSENEAAAEEDPQTEPLEEVPAEEQISAPETQNEGTMSEEADQNRDLTGPDPAMKTSMEVEQ